jgi:hypothetical protein
MNANDKILAGLILLSFCCSLVALFFGKNNDFKTGLKMLFGGFFFGCVSAYVVHDGTFFEWIKRLVVLLTSMFGKPLYDKISIRIGAWLDKIVTAKVDSVSTSIKSEPQDETKTLNKTSSNDTSNS